MPGGLNVRRPRTLMEQTEKSRIYLDYKDKVFHYAIGKGFSHDDAEDLCASVFEKVFSKIDSFDPVKASVSTWIYTITHNLVVDFFKRQRTTGPVDENIGYIDSGFDEIIKEETLEALTVAMKNLDKKSRDLIILVYYKNKTIREASESLGIPYSSSKLFIKRGLETLKEKIGL